MDQNEAQTIIKNYNGEQLRKSGCRRCGSMDAVYWMSMSDLVPVWEKREIEPFIQRWPSYWSCTFRNVVTGEWMQKETYTEGDDLNIVAAISTAKAINIIA